jgi:hypothetical protein
MDGDIAALAAQAAPYMSAAAGAYGAAVLVKIQDEAADATVGLGRRLLLKVFGAHEAGEPLPSPLASLVVNPENKDATAALRLVVQRALAASPVLQENVRDMLNAPGIGVVAAGERSIAGQVISGVAVTGDRATITRQ